MGRHFLAVGDFIGKRCIVMAVMSVFIGIRLLRRSGGQAKYLAKCSRLILEQDRGQRRRGGAEERRHQCDPGY